MSEESAIVSDEFANESEIWRHILNGGAIKRKNWRSGTCVFLEDGLFYDEVFSRVTISFTNPAEWVIAFKPQKKYELTKKQLAEAWTAALKESDVCEFGTLKFYENFLKRLGIDE